ncbi:MAG: glycosyltransferase family 4 protein [Leptolyngbya sp. SIO4C1]|nr:glycosyltransferase family 4 protein [Leptolyngbya sp. SIO4C1]
MTTQETQLKDIRLLIVLYAGDYRDVVRRVNSNRGTTHHSHPFVLEAISELSQQLQEITILCCRCPDAYNEVVYPGFRVIGSGFNPYERMSDLIRLIADYQPTHLVVRVPLKPIFNWAIKHRVPTITLLADSFFSQHWYQRLKNWELQRLLNHPTVEWVGNHGMNASQSLAAIGVKAQKIVPWDWPHPEQPSDLSAKQLRSGPSPLRLIYVGTLTERKGVGDILNAVAALEKRGLHVHFQMAGRGDREQFESQANQLGIRDRIEFLGLVPTNQVVSLMADADLVVVPSRHDYPEGLPRTIYQGLCSRSPLVVSDHPAFASRLQHRQTAMIFPAGDAAAIAACIEQLYTDSALYASLSEAAQGAWQALQISVKWADFIRRWLSQDSYDIDWLSDNSLASIHRAAPPDEQTKQCVAH